MFSLLPRCSSNSTIPPAKHEVNVEGPDGINIVIHAPVTGIRFVSVSRSHPPGLRHWALASSAFVSRLPFASSDAASPA